MTNVNRETCMITLMPCKSLMTQGEPSISLSCRFATTILVASSEDEYRLYPPEVEGHWRNRESHPDRRTPPENYHRDNPRKEAASTDHLPDGLRLRDRTSGRRGGNRHCARWRLARH